MTLGLFILTHGRPDNQKTYRLLTSPTSMYGFHRPEHLWFVCDTGDPTLPEYRRLYGDRVLTFDKEEVAATFDTMDQGRHRGSVVFARNAAIGLARDLGYEHLLELDDDYQNFHYRWLDADGVRMRHEMMRDFDAACDRSVQFLEDTGADVFAWSQGGDHYGPAVLRQGLVRKAMNVLFMRTDTPVRFLGTINEDVTAYVLHGQRGRLLFTSGRFQMDQADTQGSTGGMTGLYLDHGTYVKSFYTVMAAPSAVRVGLLPRIASSRFHHRIDWDRTTPKIVSGTYRKERP